MLLEDGVWIVTGTDTDVGKTVATAYLTLSQLVAGRDVVVVKLAQTGVQGDEPGDVAVVRELTGLPADRTFEFVRLPEPLAPTTAGRRAGVALPSVREHATPISAIAARHRVVLVEGAGGILVGLDGEGHGLLELADALVEGGVRPRFVVVARAGLGTLNHTQLTCDAIRGRGHEVASLIVGALPAEPDLAMRCNLIDLPVAAGLPGMTALPEGLGADPARLRALVEGER